MAMRLKYVDSNYNYNSDVTRVRRMGVGTNAPNSAQRALVYFQSVVTSPTSGTNYGVSNYMYIRPTATASSTDYRSLYNISQTAGGTNKQVRDIYGFYNYALNNAGNKVRNIYGTYNIVSADGAGAVTTAIFGSYNYASSNKQTTSIYGSYNYGYAKAGGTITNLYGSLSIAYNYTGKQVNSVFGQYISLRVQNAGSISQSAYGVYISGTAIAPATYTNFYSLYIAQPPQTTSANRFCLYSGSTVKSFHRGAFGIGAGATNVGTHMLRVVGTAGLSTGTTWTVFSDARLKDVIGAYNKGLKEVCKLQPKVFKYKKNDLNLDQKLRSGLIAQEVQSVFPKAITKDKEGFLQLNIDSINLAFINAIKELNTRLEKLENENKELKKCLQK